MSVRVTELVQGTLPSDDVFTKTGTLLYTLTEEVLVVVVLVGIAVWLNVAIAVTVSPASIPRSWPLTRSKVAVTV